jgi:hypothetical protein
MILKIIQKFVISFDRLKGLKMIPNFSFANWLNALDLQPFIAHRSAKNAKHLM